jgi:hypothetical protein
MRGGTGRPTRMNQSAIGALVDCSGRQVRRVQLLVPRMGGFPLPARRPGCWRAWPYQILLAQRAAASVRSARGKLRWGGSADHIG